MSRREQLLNIVEQDAQHDCDDYLCLRALMQELYQQLLSRNCNEVDLLNAKIAGLVGRVSARAERRSKILVAFKMGAGAEAMQQLFGLFPRGRGDRLGRVWVQLNQLVIECKRLNDSNGRLLAMHNEILDQLIGGGRNSDLYAPHFF